MVLMILAILFGAVAAAISLSIGAAPWMAFVVYAIVGAVTFWIAVIIRGLAMRSDHIKRKKTGNKNSTIFLRFREHQ